MAKKRTSKKKTPLRAQNNRQSKNSHPKTTDRSAKVPNADGPYPYEEKLRRKPYEKQLRNLQIELLKVQRWVKEENQKIVVVFEGRDAAGKGGTIKRFAEHLNPRGARVVALNKPTDVDRGQWFFQRYVCHLPTTGEIVLHDRSWYNRAGVEPVMGFCTPQDYQRFIHQVSHFESSIIESGIRLFKLWFDVSRKEQKRRIAARKTDPLKQWKVSPMDDKAVAHWDDYTEARDRMFLYSDTQHAPWTVVRSDDKKRARLGAIRSVLNRLPYPEKDATVVDSPDSLIVGTVDQMFPLEGRFMFAKQD